MTPPAIRVIARILFFLCGLSSLFTAFPYLLMRGADLPRQSEWIVFVAVLALLGSLSLAVALLPRSWIANACGKKRDDERLFSAPLKWLGAFAAIFYFVAVVANLAPHNWNLPPQLLFILCPLYFVKMTFDPSFMQVFLLLAPMNAGVYGAVGLALGYAWLALHKQP